MKQLFCLLLLLLTTLTLRAADAVIDLGQLELDHDYPLASMQAYSGHLIAEADGLLSMSSTTTDDMEVFADAARTQPVTVTKNSYYGAHTCDIDVQAGHTYYFYISCVWNNGTTIRFSQEETALLFLGASPAVGSTFQVSNGGQISFSFSKAVAYTGATITLAGTTSRLSGQASSNAIFFNDTKEIIWNALTAGTLHPGDTFTLTLTGVCMASHREVLYNGDGTLTADFVVGKMPLTLVSTEHTDTPFLSYFADDDDAGIVRLTFSGPVNPARLSATLKYGEVDRDADGDYYVETLHPTLSEDGCTVLVSLQGRRRKAQDMISSGTVLETVHLGILGVTDLEGNYAYASGSGSLGSYWFSKPFREVTAQVVADFSPANGADITDRTRSFEIWITDEEKLSYDGILFTYQCEGQAGEYLVPLSDIQKEQDPDDATAQILTFATPQVLIGATDINLTFHHLRCADGSDVSSVLRAKYNALVISRANPVAGATIGYLEEQQTLRLYTNKDALTSHLLLCLRDCNPAEGDREVLFEGRAERQASGSGFSLTLPRRHRLEKGHDYRLEITAMQGEGIVGSDYLLYHGAADLFRYSDTQLTEVSPAPDQTLLSQSRNYRLRLTFDGMVLLDTTECYILGTGGIISLGTLTASNPDEEGYANVWGLVLQSRQIAQAGPLLTLHIVARDAQGRPVQGNTDYKDYDYLSLAYSTDVPAAIRHLTTDRPATPAVKRIVQGQLVIIRGADVYNALGIHQ